MLSTAICRDDESSPSLPRAASILPNSQSPVRQRNFRCLQAISRDHDLENLSLKLAEAKPFLANPRKGKCLASWRHYPSTPYSLEFIQNAIRRDFNLDILISQLDFSKDCIAAKVN